MTQHQISLVRDSWVYVVDTFSGVGSTFYQHLFEISPYMKSLFSTDDGERERKLIHMLSLIIQELNSLGERGDDINKVAIRHNNYGAQPEHYKAIGIALMDTLRDVHGTSWNTELQEAWREAYSAVSTIMIDLQRESWKSRAIL